MIDLPDGEARLPAMGLISLLNTCTAVHRTGFSIDLTVLTERWDQYIKAVGVKRAYALMAAHLCEKYKAMYGREFLFSERCVAYEIEYHVDAYMWSQRFRGYYRNITTWLFKRKDLVLHCKEVDISTEDVDNLKQRLMFRYKKGIRDCYKNTPDDPFRRTRRKKKKKQSIKTEKQG